MREAPLGVIRELIQQHERTMMRNCDMISFSPSPGAAPHIGGARRQGSREMPSPNRPQAAELTASATTEAPRIAPPHRQVDTGGSGACGTINAQGQSNQNESISSVMRTPILF